MRIHTPLKINGWHLRVFHPWNFGKSSAPKHHSGGVCKLEWEGHQKMPMAPELCRKRSWCHRISVIIFHGSGSKLCLKTEAGCTLASKYPVRRYSDPKTLPKRPSQQVFGRLGIQSCFNNFCLTQECFSVL